MKLAKHFVQGPWVYVLPIFEGGKKKKRNIWIDTLRILTNRFVAKTDETNFVDLNNQNVLSLCFKKFLSPDTSSSLQLPPYCLNKDQENTSNSTNGS